MTTMLHIKPIVDAFEVHKQHYANYGDYSVTTLNNPDRYVHLHKRHSDDLVYTISNQLASFIGTAVHRYLDHCLNTYKFIDPKYTIERSVYDKINGRLLGGTFDILYDNTIIYDHKNISVWSTIFDPQMNKFQQQLNTYRYLLHRRGIDTINDLRVIAIYKDWREGDAFRRNDYPQDPIMEYKIPVWPIEQIESWVYDRIESLKSTEDIPDDELPECPVEERWERHPDGATVKYAAFKSDKAPKASRVFNKLLECKEYMLGAKGFHADSFIEVRYAQRKRCEKWCTANKHCNHYALYEEMQTVNNLTGKIMMEELI